MEPEGFQIPTKPNPAISKPRNAIEMLVLYFIPILKAIALASPQNTKLRPSGRSLLSYRGTGEDHSVKN